MRPRIFIVFLLITSVILIFSNFTGKEENESPHPYDFKYSPTFGKPNIPPDNPLTIEGVWLGRLLFYDSLLSINGKMSCGSCHQQKLYFTDGRALAVGVHGDTLKRNTMALMNVAWGNYFFWDGRARTVESLVKEPIQNPQEMGGLSEKVLIIRIKAHKYYPELFQKAFPGEAVSLNTVSKAIAQFLYTIVGQIKNTSEDFKDRGGYESEKFVDKLSLNSSIGTRARMALMQCKICHTSQAFGGRSVQIYENDSAFKAPSLMNIRFTGPYMHDGRFKTLREVFQFYNDSTEAILRKNPELEPDQRIITKFTEFDLEHADEAFSVFEDTTVSTNPQFSDPFGQKGFTWYGMNGQNAK